MSYVTCHTRGNTSGQGKAKIWLCVHPDECETYLGPISENIYNVNYRDWAVWYDNEPTEDCDEDLLKKLSRIELFVVPVTWKLLNEPNRAMDVEIPFAIQHHIPVLPLMQASGLVDRFNERFHNLQYIDAADVDFAAKLKNYLTRILVEGEQIDEIKRNFAKHIFLSYRKKDRFFVSKIMSEIHRHDCLRRVSIWFDDFLNPGENFDNQILEVIDKCDMVVLLVTPHILEDGNYVLTCEYDEAKKRKKYVLPVEAIKTDTGEYHEKYPTLPKAVSLECSDEIQSILSSAFADVEDICSTPESDYLYGLAYLNGIDVEKNYEYAVIFLEKAAREGYTPAIEKLSSMYTSGHGVAFSYPTALYWKNKAVECSADRYRVLLNEESAVSYIDTLRAYASLLSDAYMQKETYESHILRCKVCEEVCSRFPQSFWFKRDLLEAYMAVSQMHVQNKKLESASECLQRVQELAELLDTEEGGESNAYNLAASYAGLAEIYEEQEDWAGAKRNYRKAVEYAQKIVAKSLSKINDSELEEKNEAILSRNVDPPIIHLITLCWMSLGDIGVIEHDSDAAKYYYHDAERSLLGYSVGNGSLLLTDSTIRLFAKLLKLYCSENNRHQSLIYCKRGIELCGIAKDDAWNPAMLRNGIALLNVIKKTCDQFSLYGIKNEVFRLEIELLEEFVIKTADAEHFRIYCDACGRYAAAERNGGNASLSLEYCNRAIALLQKYGYLLPSELLLEYSYRFYSDASRDLAACGNVRMAIEYCEQRFKLCNSSEIENSKNRLADVCGELFDLYCEIGEKSQALKYIQQACEICGDAVETEGSTHLKRKFSILLEKLAGFYLENEKNELARNCMTYSASLSNEIFQVQKDAQSYDDLLHSCICMMQVSTDDEKAVTMWQNNFFIIMQAYVSEFSSFLDGEMLGAAVEKMMAVEELLGESAPWEKVFEILKVYSTLNDLCAQINADEVLEKSYARIEHLGERILPLIESDGEVAAVCRILCHANKLMGRKLTELTVDGAAECYTLSLEYAKAWYDLNPSNESMDALADACQSLGNIYAETDADKAITYYLEAIDVYKRMIVEYGEIYEKHNYVTTGILLGKLYISVEKQSLALALYEEMLNFMDRDLDLDRQYPKMRAIVLEKSGDVYFEKKDGRWEPYYRRALDIFEKIYRVSPNVQSAHDVEIIAERIARSHFLAGDVEEAESRYLELERIQDSIYKEEPILRNLKKRKETVGILAEIYEEHGDVESAVTYYEKLIKICERVREHEPTEQAWFEYAVALFKVARLRHDEFWLKQALRIFEFLKNNSANGGTYEQIIASIHEELSQW